MQKVYQEEKYFKRKSISCKRYIKRKSISRGKVFHACAFYGVFCVMIALEENEADEKNLIYLLEKLTRNFLMNVKIQKMLIILVF